jgi:ubiquinone/menaquinone biosynthesis C-methylase UbiE
MLTAMANSSADSKERFSSRVDAYVAARPRYPQEIIPHLQSEIGLTPQWTIADVGSGTGISCEMFLANGNSVIGVEPNAAMRAAAEKSLASSRHFQCVNGSAEATTLPDASIDLAVAAQAFHWFDIEKARCEFQRILRPSGHAALIWNVRKLGGSPFLDAYEGLLKEFSTDYMKIRHENIDDAARTRFFGTPHYRSAVFPNHQHLDWDGLRARLLSSSYTPQPDDPRHEPMLARLRQIYDQHSGAGTVTIEYRTELFYGRLMAA